MTDLTYKMEIKQEYYFDVDPESAFKALIEPRRLVKWFLKDAEIRPIEGSSYKFTWLGGSSHSGKVKRVVPNKSRVLTWPDRSRGGRTRLRSLSPLARGGMGLSLG